MHNMKQTDKILNELGRQGCDIKEKRNTIMVVPPDPEAGIEPLHKTDGHVGALVDHCLKRYNHFLNFEKLKKYHRRFGNGPKD